MRKIKWNPIAKEDYLLNIEFLLNHWSENEAQRFIDKVSEIEQILMSGKVEFRSTTVKGVYRCVIVPQIVLFYKVHSDSDIEFLRFWTVHKNPKGNKLD